MLKKKTLLGVVFVFLFCALLGSEAFAAQHKEGDTYHYTPTNRVIGRFVDSETLEYIPSTNSNFNFQNLKQIMAEEGKLTIIFPSGSDFHINGPIYPSSNKTIIATGAKITMKPKTYVMFTNPKDKIHDLKVIGGTWRSPDPGGRKGSMFQLAFADNVVLDGVDVDANFNGHAIEIIACTNVTVQNCTVRAIGTNPANCKEEAIQIDVSTKQTAPKVAKVGAEWVKGQVCSNIYILNNKVFGARAIGVNYHSSQRKKYHKNIVIKGNQLHSTTSEALQFYNVIGGEISGNIIRTDATRKQNNKSYTIAVHIQNNGEAPAAMAKSKIVVKKNTIYGNRNGIYVKGYNITSKKKSGLFGTVQISDNKVYCKNSKKAAIDQTKGSCRKWVEKKNKTYKWKKSVTPAVDLR